MDFKQYPNYKESGVEWLGEVPEHWYVTSVKRAYNVKLGKMLQPEKKNENDVLKKFLKASNISWTDISSTENEMWFSENDILQLRLEKGDLLITEGGDVGKSCIWDSAQEMYYQNSINRVRPKPNGLNKFLYYFIFSLKSIGYIDILCNKATIAHFTAEKLNEMILLLPSINEQIEIVSFLDSETSRIDNLIAKQEKLIEKLEEHRKSVISHAVTKGLDPNVQMKDSGVEWWGEVPEHWQYATLKRVLHILTDYTANGSFADLAKNVTYLDEGFSRLVRLTDLRENLLNKGIYVSKDAHTYLKKSELFGGDVLLANVGAYAGFACLMPSLNVKATLAPNMFLLRFKNNVDNDFMHFYLNSAFAQTQLKMQMTSTAQPKLNKDNVRSIILFIPHIDVQINIVEFIKSESLKIDKLIFKQKQLINRLKEYRASIISHAVTGKIDVRDLVA